MNGERAQEPGRSTSDGELERQKDGLPGAAKSPNMLAALLVRIRESKRMSIPAMAEKLSVSRNTLGDYERGVRLPDVEFLGRFATVNGCDAMELLDARLTASGEAAAFDDALRRIRGATQAVVEFALRRSSVDREAQARMQEEAFAHRLTTADLEARYGAQYDPMAAPHLATLDVDRLRQVLEGVEIALRSRSLRLPADKHAELVGLLYEWVGEEKSLQAETVQRFLKLVA
jgi:transcriptional regulator with XRE-family HTH domain